MNKKNGVIIPLDGSAVAARALGAAQALAITMDAVLHIVHVTDKPVSDAQLMQDLNVGELQVTDFVFHQIPGDVVEVVLGFAAREEIKIIVMSSHGTTYNEAALLGHIGLEIIQKSADPVMIIRPDMRNLPDPQWRPVKMLVPLNGSPAAAAAMGKAFELADALKCQIDVVHIAVLGVRPPQEAGSMATPRYLDYAYYEWAAWAKEFMERFARRPSSVKLRLLHRRGVPAEEMLKMVEESSEDLIVLAWQGCLEKDRAETIKQILKKTEVPIILIKSG